MSSILEPVASRWQSLRTGGRVFYDVVKPEWTSPETRLAAWSYLGLILVLMWLNAKLNVAISDATKDLMSSVARKDPQSVRDGYAQICALLVLAAAPVAAFYAYRRTRLAIWIREKRTERLFGGYFTNQAFLKLLDLIRKNQLDNPDQRMTSDVDSFSNSLVGLFISFTDAGITIYVWYSVLWSISHELTWGVISYALAGTLIVFVIGKPLIALTNQLLRSDTGDLRHELLAVGQEAQSIAIYRGEHCARELLSGKLRIVIATLVNIARKNLNITLFTTAFNGMVPLIAPWFVGSLYAAGQVKDFGTITQAGICIGFLMVAFGTVMAQFPGIAAFITVVYRIGSLEQAIADCGVEQLPADKRINVTSGQDLVFDNVTVFGADLETAFVRNLTFKLPQGESLIIIGPDGAGKTELLMVLAGLANAGHGQVQRQPIEEIMFLTEKPYLPADTSIRQLVSRCGKGESDEEIRKALRMVNMEGLEQRAGGLDSRQHWDTFLKSPGEGQRLSLARIFIARPKCVAIDEVSAALDHETQKLIYGALMATGATVITAADERLLSPLPGTFKPILPQLHTWVMTLAGDGTYNICRASEYQKR